MTPEKKILVIEDDPQMRKLLVRTLELSGYTIGWLARNAITRAALLSITLRRSPQCS
jgi:DNA-binding response OmpR family regulator